MNPRLIGRMVLARWLDYPPDRYEKQVEAVTRSRTYSAMASRIQVVYLPGAIDRDEAGAPVSNGAVARLLLEDGREAGGREVSFDWGPARVRVSTWEQLHFKVLRNYSAPLPGD